MPAPPTKDQLRRLPKAELHCHLDGSLRPGTLLELGREYGVTLPRASVAEMTEYMLVADAQNLEDYLRRFETTISVMQSADSLERIAYELAADAAGDGVRYMEVRNAPSLNTGNGLSLEDAVRAPIRGLLRAEEEFGIKGRFIVCGLRNLSPDHSLEMARLAVAFRNEGVVAFDLAGGEKGNPASAHARAFAHARENNLAVTVHAGEGDGAESVRQAVHTCGADRLGHATRLIEDAELTQYVNDRRIGLEICLTSNVQTRAVASYADHPLREYFDRGMNVSLNTDNRLMSGTTLTDEYHHAARDLGFTIEEVCSMALNGFESAFLPWEERMDLLEDVTQDIEALMEEAG